MYFVILYAVLFSICTAGSIVLIGDRSLISGNLLSFSRIVQIIFHWKFITSMVLALGSRFLFIVLNNHLLEIPALARNATTTTAFITTSSYVAIIFANMVFLNERLTFSQAAGCVIIMVGICLVVK